MLECKNEKTDKGCEKEETWKLLYPEKRLDCQLSAYGSYVTD